MRLRSIALLGFRSIAGWRSNSIQWRQVAGNLNFDGMVQGNLTDPIVDGKASLDSITLRGRNWAGSTDVFVSPDGVDLKNGKLVDGSGGNAEFAVNMPGPAATTSP
ncbi:MAG: hypothetical protein IPP63_19415 [Chloracidobacterium sp.]|nr:hypothetical protein [Chloracidobacterium sp.]